MTVKKVWAVYFSGTGTTKKTVDRIARRLAEALGTDCEVYDYTLPAARRQELTIPSGDVAVVGCPTYAGRVPNLLMPYLRDMVHGEGALAVPVVLFGNRNYDDALMELSQLLTAGGFSCVAGGAFVGEHSFSRTLGAGRPSGADVGEMDAFAEHVAAKLVAGDTAPVTVGGCDPIRPLSVFQTWRVAQEVAVDVVGCGGIVCAADVKEYMAAGAKAVEIGTANFTEPETIIRITEAL